MICAVLARRYQKETQVAAKAATDNA